MTKQEIGELLSAFKDQVVLLKEELAKAREREEKLQAQVERLQNGLMAVRSPEAYRDMKADEREPTISASMADAQKKEQQIRKIRESYIRAIEGNVLQSGEDLDVMMESVLARGGAMKSKSMHGNSES